MTVEDIHALEEKLNRAKDLKSMIDTYNGQISAMEEYFRRVDSSKSYMDLYIDCVGVRVDDEGPEIKLNRLKITDKLKKSIMSILVNERYRYLTELEEL